MTTETGKLEAERDNEPTVAEGSLRKPNAEDGWDDEDVSRRTLNNFPMP